MIKTRLVLTGSVFVWVAAFGCGVEGDGAGDVPRTIDGLAYAEDGTLDPTSIPSTGMVPRGCVKIEGGEVGERDLVLSMGSRTITFTGWAQKDGEAEEIGFSYVTTGGGVAYAVKAGRETHYGNQSPWNHPGGTGGPNAPGISNITFCPDRGNSGGGGAGGASGGGTGGSDREPSGGIGGSTGAGGAGGAVIIVE